MLQIIVCHRSSEAQEIHVCVYVRIRSVKQNAS